MAKLTDKQRRFVELYCGECKFNATQAAKGAGYSEHTAKDIGGENLSKPTIQEAISETMAGASKKSEVTVEYLVERLKLEAEREDEGASHSARISAISKLTDFTGGFDKNKNHTVHSGKIGLKDISEMSDDELEAELNK